MCPVGVHTLVWFPLRLLQFLALRIFFLFITFQVFICLMILAAAFVSCQILSLFAWHFRKVKSFSSISMFPSSVLQQRCGLVLPSASDGNSRSFCVGGGRLRERSQFSPPDPGGPRGQAPGPLASKKIQNHAVSNNFKGETPYFEHILGSGPLLGQNSAGPPWPKSWICHWFSACLPMQNLQFSVWLPACMQKDLVTTVRFCATALTMYSICCGDWEKAREVWQRVTGISVSVSEWTSSTMRSQIRMGGIGGVHALQAYRKLPHTSTGECPLFLATGQDPSYTIDHLLPTVPQEI